MIRLFSVLVIVVVIDQLTKISIVKSFALYESLEIVPRFFNLTYVTNTGAAFGMLAGAPSTGRQIFFITVAIVALIALIFAYRQLHQKGVLYGYSLALIASGAIGNLIDRIRLGYVIDFLDFFIGDYHWPAFNIADSAISIGVGIFLLASFLESREENHQAVES